ncbi:MAG: hypothetical protein WAZ48_16630 [Lysobacteraceae bacterium]
MQKPKYTPFLKVKANEVAAVASLSTEILNRVTPFFDLPRKDGMTSDDFKGLVTKSAKKLVRYLGESKPFYLDNFDIPDDIKINNRANFEYIALEFSKTHFIPVIGLDRTDEHNQSVLKAKKDGLVKSDKVAIRILEDEFDNYALISKNFLELIESAFNNFERIVLVLDCRFCLNVSPTLHAEKLAKFIDAVTLEVKFEEVIVTGSSIPASIAEVANSKATCDLPRVELSIFRKLKSVVSYNKVDIGDYTVVSPMYSDLTLPPEMMQNVMAPKVIYSYDDVHFVARGGALKSHARGSLQYNDIAAIIVAKLFFRGSQYSFGDNFMEEKAKGIGPKVTPSSVLKPTINAHITYMLNGHPLTI